MGARLRRRRGATCAATCRRRSRPDRVHPSFTDPAGRLDAHAHPRDQRRRRRLPRHPARSPPRSSPTATTCSWSRPPTTAAARAPRSASSTAPVRRRSSATCGTSCPTSPVHAIDAPPATAVFAACLGAFGDLPDLVASGINPGANTGHLVLHSGTVGATLTGAGLRRPGHRGVDASGAPSSEYHWETAARFAAAAVEWVGQARRRRRASLNINVPNLPARRDARRARGGARPAR